MLALLNGLRIVEVPVNYRARVGKSADHGSRVTTLKVGTRMIGLILDYRLKSWRQRRGSGFRVSGFGFPGERPPKPEP